MSMWGKRVDAWFDHKTGANNVEQKDYDRAGLRLLGLVVAAAVLGLLIVLLDQADDGLGGTSPFGDLIRVHHPSGYMPPV